MEHVDLSTVAGPEPVTGPEVVESDLRFVADELDDVFRTLAGSNLLITGGAGFLGYYLVQAPLWWNRCARGPEPIDVTVLDTFIRGCPPWLEELEQDRHLRVITHDVTRPLPGECPAPDWVIHAASIASPTFYREHPIETMDANVGGLRQLLDYAVERAGAGRPVRGMLFFSSSEVYGDPDPDHVPTAESYWGRVSFTGPRACYDESKRFGETLCTNFARKRGVPVKVVRPFNNYGPGLRLDDGRVIPDFARDVLAGRDIRMHSDGSPSRTFCYVADAVVGYYKVLVHGRSGEAYNIGTEKPEISIVDLAELVARLGSELLGYEGRVVRAEAADVDYLVDNPNRRCPVIDKAADEVGYRPGVGLEEGLRRSLLWYRDQGDAP